MKKIALFILLALCPHIAYSNVLLLAGMRNQKFALGGLQWNHYGVVFEQSLYNQDFKQQYGRLYLLANYTTPFHIDFDYMLFAGTQYDQSYSDFSGALNAQWKPFGNIAYLSGSYGVLYDSELGSSNIYQVKFTTTPFSEIGLFVGFKNTPEFRIIERRFDGGITFKASNLFVTTEMSVPQHGSYEWTRYSVSFIYQSQLF